MRAESDPSAAQLKRALALPPVVSSDEKRQLQSLLLVQPRIAETGVVCAEILGRQALAAAYTLCDGVAGEFQVHTPEIAAVLAVNAEGGGELGVDGGEETGFDA